MATFYRSLLRRWGPAKLDQSLKQVKAARRALCVITAAAAPSLWRARRGTIVINTRERRLYLVLDGEVAIRYAVGVGRAGRQWQGGAVIDGAHIEPAWAPTPEIKRDNPSLPDVIPGGTPGNPMGARALTLSGGEYAIHGTNRPESIGTYHR